MLNEDILLTEAILQDAVNSKKLYHYAPGPFSEVLTLREQIKRKLIPQNDKELYSRDTAGEFRGTRSQADWMCFFFEPVPLDVIGGAYPATHKAWSPGNVLWELEIDAAILDCDYYVVETDHANFVGEYLWPGSDANPIVKQAFFKFRKLIATLYKDRGHGQSGISNAIDRYKGRTREAYKHLLASDDFVNVNHMYAPSVPHLIIWPDNGAVPVMSKRRITIPTKTE